MRGAVRHVVQSVIGGVAVLADVSAKQREIPGVTRPAPIVDFAAIVADTRRRREHEPHVAQLELLDQVVTTSAVEALELAARPAARLLACRDRLLLVLLERAFASEIVFCRGERALHGL